MEREESAPLDATKSFKYLGGFRKAHDELRSNIKTLQSTLLLSKNKTAAVINDPVPPPQPRKQGQSSIFSNDFFSNGDTEGSQGGYRSISNRFQAINEQRLLKEVKETR